MNSFHYCGLLDGQVNSGQGETTAGGGRGEGREGGISQQQGGGEGGREGGRNQPTFNDKV